MGGWELLRMLEPLVRPANTGALNRAGTKPLEQRPFEELLAEARAEATDGASSQRAEAIADAAPLGKATTATGKPMETSEPAGYGTELRLLREVGRIENESLRRLLSGD